MAVEVHLLMVNVHDYAHSLARALKESPEYQAYRTANERIRENATARQMITDFHRQQMEMQALSLQSKEPSKEQQEALQRLYAMVQAHAEVRDFLALEQRLGVLLNDVYKIIGDAMELEIAAGP